MVSPGAIASDDRFRKTKLYNRRLGRFRQFLLKKSFIEKPMTTEQDWLQHSVQVEVETPLEHVWALWSDLEQMPRWMRWIESVHILEDNPKLSQWKLSTGGWDFSWLSRIVKIVPHQIIQWESVDGLPNRGAIRFYDRKDRSIVRMSVSYAIPGLLGKLMDNLFLGRVVESTLKADLDRFRDYALQAWASDHPPNP